MTRTAEGTGGPMEQRKVRAIPAFMALLCFLGGAANAECLVLGDLGYVLPVEGEVTVTQSKGSVTLDLAPGGRAPELITLRAVDKSAMQIPDTPEEALLSNGLTLHYRPRTGEVEGSSGAEVFLGGWLEGETPLSVSCSTIGKYISPEWCLPMLAELRPVAVGCTTDKE
jgi:hypothetical protein